MACHISFRDVEFLPSEKGVRIQVWTDVPSHVWIRLSSAEPRIHKQPSMRRGMQFAEDVRFCFTVYEDNEQYESGDTLVHTFYKEQWPVCTTKYFYFWGSVAGEVCISSSPYFSYHNNGVSPVPTPDVLRTFNSIEPNRIPTGPAPAWVSIDLAPYVSPDATGVLFHIAPGGGWAFSSIRKPDAAGNFQVQNLGGNHVYGIAGLGGVSGLEIEVRNQIGDDLQLWLLGYFNKNVEFLDVCPSYQSLADNLWHTFDLPAAALTAQAGIFLVGGRESSAWTWGIRPYGSTDDRRGMGWGTYAIVKINDGKIDLWAAAFQDPGETAVTLVGYIMAGGTFNTNSVNIDPPATSTWTEKIVVAPPSNPTLAILDWHSTAAPTTYGARKRDGDHSWVTPMHSKTFPFAHPGPGNIIDLYRQKAQDTFHLHGLLF